MTLWSNAFSLSGSIPGTRIILTDAFEMFSKCVGHFATSGLNVSVMAFVVTRKIILTRASTWIWSAR
jgi:hypothetical protein